KTIFYFFSALFFSGSSIFSGISPFGVAFVAGSGGKYFIPAGIGSILGYLFLLGNDNVGVYIISLILVCVAKWFLHEKPFVVKQKDIISCILVAPIFGAISLVVGFASYTSSYDILLIIAELLLVSSATYFFSRTDTILSHRTRSLRQTEICCILITCCILIISLNAYLLGGLSIGAILGLTAIMIGAYGGGITGGAVIGICVGISSSFASIDTLYLAGIYSFIGLMGGVFAGFSKLSIAVVVVIINGFSVLFSKDISLIPVYQAFVASIAFMIIPENALHALTAPFIVKTKDTHSNTLKELLFSKLQYTASAMNDIAQTTQKVSEKLNAISENSIDTVYDLVADKVCKRCGFKTKCYQTNYNHVMSAFSNSVATIKQEGVVTNKTIDSYFVRTCCKLQPLVDCLNLSFNDYISKEGIKRKVTQVRGIVTDQFNGMGLLLQELAEQVEKTTIHDPNIHIRISDMLFSKKINPAHVRCYVDEYDRMSVEVEVLSYKLARINMEQITVEISDICTRDLDMPILRKGDKSTLLIFAEKCKYTVEYGACQQAASKNKFCGDSYNFFSNCTGNANIILSDGMGTGGSAAVDSAMTSSLVSKLLEAGISHNATLKMVNSALLVKSGEESLATIDVSSIDLYNGHATFYKAGAAPTFVRKSGKAGYVQSTSLPVGILRGVDFEKSAITLHDQDIIVMVSDGVVNNGTDWIKSELESFEGTAQDLSERILKIAKERIAQDRSDDMTVICAYLKKVS
ncbi:MAG: SpoIIE family protein phosphatase, partial [Oscillospiraceae bacterium]